MSCLEVKKLHVGRLCEACLQEKGPSRSGIYAIFLCGYPVDHVCGVHRQMWEREFARERARGRKRQEAA